MGEHEKFGDELKREWFSQRARQIHEELIRDLNRYATDILPERRRAILAASGHSDEGQADVTAIAAADNIATAEGVLAAVAVYLARKEANTPETG